MAVELGLIEGYYGAPWSWDDRAETVALLAPYGYGFYIYAPKADIWLRRRWREDFPDQTREALTALAAHCAALGVQFGVGLSPFEIYRDFNAEAKAALGRKLAVLDEIGVNFLAILFDDMRGDLPDLARNQIEILNWIRQRSGAARMVACPTYYSDDPMLDRVFGRRPPGYLEDLGADLDPAIELFWTGTEVCSREFQPGSLDVVAAKLQRKPVLWDNYPVNDSPTMCQHLHIRAFTGRSAAIGGHIHAHAVNPALQPVLSRIPALTLAASYQLGDAYDYGRAFNVAAQTVLGPDLAARVQSHLPMLQDTGLDRLGERAGRLRSHYIDVDHPAAREIVAWLDGAYRFTADDLAET